MDPLAGTYVVTTTVLALAGSVLFAFAVSAYRESGRRSMAALMAGFGLIVAAAVGTPALWFAGAVADPVALLAVNTGLYAAATSLVAVSLVVYEPGTREFVIPESELTKFQK